MAATRLSVGLVNIRWGLTPPLWASLHLVARCEVKIGRAICTTHLVSFTTIPTLDAHVLTGSHDVFWECNTHGPEALEKA
jgi:hypothetical protein